ncbi:MAG: TonB-dependent receptor, partial [Candidatus Binatia bacterium]
MMGGWQRVLALALALGAPLAARAQDAAPAAPKARTIEEIVITAQKREQNIQDVPISVSALDGDFMAEQAITDFRDVSLVVPNVAVDNLGEFNDIRIRGFGSPLSNKAFEQSVGLAIDGIAYGRREYFLGPLFDLERVEVLRGPQGTLFGKNNTAGLFNVTTRQPTDEYTADVGLEYGDFDRKHVSLGVGGPLLEDWVNVRVSGLFEEREGYVDNTTAPYSDFANPHTSGRERKGIRAQVGFPDLFGVKLVLSYEHVEVDLDAGGWEFRLTKANVRPFFRTWDPEADFTPFNYKGSIDETLAVAQRFDTFVANASYEIGGWTFFGVGGYAMLKDDFQHADPDFTPAPIFFSSDKDENPQTTAEVRAMSPSLPGFLGLGELFSWALGTT